MQKILIITPDYPPDIYGGIGTHVLHLTEKLKKEYELIVFTIRLKKVGFENPIIRRNAGITVIDFPTKYEKITELYKVGPDTHPFIMGQVNYLVFNYLDELIKENSEICLIHNHFFYFNIMTEIFRKNYKIPVVTTHHFFTIWGEKKNYLDMVMRHSITSSDANIFVSKWLCDYAKQATDLDNIPNQQVIYNGMDFKDSESYLKKPIRDKESVEITYCGRLSKLKGVDILLKAVRIFKLNNNLSQKVHVTIVGDGAERDNLKQLAKDLLLDDCVTFTGYLSQPLAKQKMRESDVMVIPSLNEPFGLVALEAMANGTAVLASNSGGLKEIIVDGENGIFFLPNDEMDLALKLQYIITHPTLKLKLETQGKLTASKFDWDEIAHETSEVYKSLIGKYK